MILQIAKKLIKHKVNMKSWLHIANSLNHIVKDAFKNTCTGDHLILRNVYFLSICIIKYKPFALSSISRWLKIIKLHLFTDNSIIFVFYNEILWQSSLLNRLINTYRAKHGGRSVTVTRSSIQLKHGIGWSWC